MKPNEIMIGDYVVRDSHKNNPVQVLELHKQSAMLKLENGWCGEAIDLIEPIPLTPEILEKNGWHFDDLINEWYNNNHAPKLYGRNCSSLSMFDGSVIVGNVHELQHALRLCGLNDLADNFKV